MQYFTKRLVIAALCGALGLAAVETDFFQTADTNGDGYITRDELRGAMTQWLGGRARVDKKELTSALNGAFPEAAFMGLISPPRSKTPKPEDQQKMEAALPESAPAKPFEAAEGVGAVSSGGVCALLDSAGGEDCRGIGNEDGSVDDGREL